ncbi:MAG: hypothetical protein K0U54_07410, partial [Bacteroidetes bacterium]|nr:hypothetical protein [Bacteroidota bacterium]
VMALTLTSCKNAEEKTEAQVETNAPKLLDNEAGTYSGEFIYISDGAVLKGANFIYGVAINEMAEELREKVAPIKKEEFDMVPVVVKGKLSKKSSEEEGWEDVLTITEIVNVSDAPAEADIKIEDTKEE